MLSVFICVISGKCSFLPRISQICTDLVTCYPCSFVSSVGNIFPPTDFTDFHRFGYMLSVFICVISGECSFLPRISRIFTDLVTCYPCSFVSSVGNVLFSHGFHRFARIWLHVIRVHLCYQWGMFFSPTDFTDFHRFGYMLSVFICVISGKCSFLPRISQICTDLIINYPWVLCLWVK